MNEAIQVDAQGTDHTKLEIWDQFVSCLGTPQAFVDIPMSQKTVTHTVQNKVLEFLVANLDGVPYAKDISKATQPLDQNQAVAAGFEPRTD